MRIICKQQINRDYFNFVMYIDAEEKCTVYIESLFQRATDMEFVNEFDQMDATKKLRITYM